MDGKLDNAAWVTWERQTRNRSMASALNVPLFELESSKPRLLRYVTLAIATLSLIKKHKVRYLFVQNPSIVLAFIAVIMRHLFSYVVIVDAHNAGIKPFDGRSKIANAVTGYIIRRAALVIVTNRILGDLVRAQGGRDFVMPDPIPALQARQSTREAYLLLICSWSDDEPYEAIIKAMALRPSLKLLITGNYTKRLTEAELAELPDNVMLTGRVSDAEYVETLARARLAIDLTTRADCLVCGAYEAASLATPCLISDSAVNREVFYSGYVYTDIEVRSIDRAIGFALDNLAALQQDIKRFSSEHQDKITGRAGCLLREIYSLSG